MPTDLPNPTTRRLFQLGLPISPYPIPPCAIETLPALPPMLDAAPPSGLLSALVGERYGVETMQDSDIHDERIWPWLDRVRAWSVPCLMETAFSAPHLLGTLAACLQHLRRVVPAATWGVNPADVVYGLVGPLQKYGLLHVRIPAPPDTATNQAMGLELAGRITTLNGAAIDSVEGRQLWEQLYAAPWDLQNELAHAHWLHVLQITLFQATYANVQGTSIGIGFCM